MMEEMILRVINGTDETFAVREGDTFKGELRQKMEEDCVDEIIGDIKNEMLKCGQSVTDEQRLQLLHLVNEYRECFALKLEELGCTNAVMMDIKDDGVPVRCQPYKTTEEDRKTIAKLVDELKACGIVQETNSPYASPVILVKKKNVHPRLVVDYRRLNKQTVRMNFTVPGIDEQFKSLAGCEMYTTLDLANGYMQVPLTTEARPKTAFITPDTTGEFTRMVFGLTNAPFEFVRMMNLVLGPLRNEICHCYLDDVIIPANNWCQMLERLKLVLECFQKAQLTLNIKKREFGKEKIEYLGYVVGKDGLRPGPIKIAAIENFPERKNVHEVRRFLGLTGFFRRFIRRYAQLAKPLSDLTKKDKPFEFTEKCNKVFENLKLLLMEAPVLKLFSAEDTTELHTDASAVGVAGMLLQRDANNQLRLVYCVSKKTTEAESKYHSTRLELLAVVWCIERLRGLLLGIKFKVITDCQAITYLHSKRSVHPQIARRFATLQEYDFILEHRRGTSMSHVDALSRAPVEPNEDTEDYVYDRRVRVLLTFTEEQIAMIQQSDGELKRKIDIMRKPVSARTKEEKDIMRDYEYERGKLFMLKNVENRTRRLYVIPKTMRKSIVVQNHDLAGHFSVDRTFSRILTKFWFPGMRRYVRRHIAECMECLANKIPGGKKPGLLHPIPTPSRPFQRVHMDNLGPFVKSSRGNSYICIIVDAFTRFTTLYPVKSTKTSAIVRCMEDLILRFGKPETIVCDRGTCFTSTNFKNFCGTQGIRLIYNSPRHPQANGMVERVNRTIIPVIQAEMKNENSWDMVLKKVQFDLNTSVNKTNRQTPYKMLMGYNHSIENDKLGLVSGETQYENVEKLREAVKEEIAKQ